MGESPTAAGLVVVEPGLATTVQDLGRWGWRGFGVPVGGAFDLGAHGLANALVGNSPGHAALELTMLGGLFRAVGSLALAFAGAPFRLRLDGRPLDSPASFTLRDGETLDIGGTPRGVRGYLAVRGGWRTPPILGSSSSEIPLHAGDFLPAVESSIPTRRPAPAETDVDLDRPLRLIDGPDGPAPGVVLESDYRVGAASDRVGIRLEGTPVEGYENRARPSAPVAPGAVQVAGERLIILGVAGGTMGGYPHVGHVISADLERLAQARPGQTLRFARIDLAGAVRLDVERRRLLASRYRLLAVAAMGSTLD